jgi:peptide/nickel transport system permease protein
MKRVVALRLLGMVLVLLALVLVVFVLQRAAPGDPARLYLGGRAEEALVAAKRHELGLDRPLPVQYVHYLWLLVRGDLQDSLHTRRPVTTDLGEFLPASIELLACALLVASAGGWLLGIVSAARWRGGSLLRLTLVTGASIPVFLVALGGVILFSRELGWLPAIGRTTAFDAPDGPTGFLLVDSLVAGRLGVFGDALRHLVLPALSLAIGSSVAVGRVFRSSLVATLRSDYVRTARAKGLREREVLYRHAVRNSLGTPLAVAGLQLAVMMGSLVVVELIFAWPGIGQYMARSVAQRDFPSIAGTTLVLGALYVVVNAVVDIVQVWADPRLRAAV